MGNPKPVRSLRRLRKTLGSGDENGVGDARCQLHVCEATKRSSCFHCVMIQTLLMFPKKEVCGEMEKVLIFKLDKIQLGKSCFLFNFLY